MNGQAVSQADDPQEQWNRVHAQLLKSVADAQAKLLAAQNETNDRLERMDRDLRVLIGQTQETVRNSHVDVSGRVERAVDTIAGIIKDQLDTLPPAVAKAKRRELHRLAVKASKRAVERKRRQ